MGWEHIKAAFKYKGEGLGETALHVLLRIAWEVRDNEYAFPGTAYLAEKIHVSRKTVQRAINELSAAGAITVRSGRFSGRQSHYYLTFEGAPAVDIGPVDIRKQGGTKTTLSTPAPVDNSPEEVGQKRPHAGEVGQIRPTGVGQAELDLGQICREGWDKNDHGEKIIKQETDSVSLSQAVRNVPPPHEDGTMRRIPPVGTLEFKAYAIHFCREAGAPLEEARRFYEHNQAEDWKVLVEMPLEVAAAQWVKNWPERDRRGWTHYQLDLQLLKERRS